MKKISREESVDQAKRRLCHWKALICSIINPSPLWYEDDEIAFKTILAELDGPSEKERKEMWHWIESWRNLCRDGMVHGCDKCKLTENGRLAKAICEEYRNKIHAHLADNSAPEKEEK